MISVTASSSSVASLRSTIRSTIPASSRTTRPRSPASMASTAIRAIAASSRRRSSRSSREEPGFDERNVPVEHEHLVDVVRQGRHGRRDRVAGAARLGLEGVVDVVAERVADRGGRRRRDDERAAAGRRRRGIDDVGDHRPAAQLVQELRGPGLHPRPETGRQHDGGDPWIVAGTWRGHEGRRRLGAAVRGRIGSGPGAGVSGGWCMFRVARWYRAPSMGVSNLWRLSRRRGAQLSARASRIWSACSSQWTA